MAAMALAACTHAAAPAPGADLSPQARWEAGQAARLAWNARQAGWQTTESGLQHRRVKAAPAASPKPEPGATVSIHYTGTFIDGREFDSSRTRGEPATFPLGQLIKGWQEGVPMMRVGETWEFVIPSRIAYGERYRDPIPANSTLLFEIELIAIPGDQD